MTITQRLASLCLLLAAAAASAATPEQVAREYLSAAQDRGLAASADFMHQDEMARFKSMVLPMFLAEAEGGKRDLLSATLGPQATIEDLRATSAEAFYRAFMRAMVAQTGLDPTKEQANEALIEKARSIGANAVVNVKYTSGIGFTTWGYIDAKGVGVKLVE